ncbi:hypothetical protein ACWIUD_07570 [Helicobacter sp. 23-1044]
MLLKKIKVKSLKNAESAVDSAFLNDIEISVIVKCANLEEIKITFFALDYDLEHLVAGYFGAFGLSVDFRRVDNVFYIDSPLSKDEILSHLSQKDFIQSCEQIEINDKKIERDRVVMPFNGSRAKISSEFLEKNRGFFVDSSVNFKNAESTKVLAVDSRKNPPSLAEGVRGWVDSAKLDSAFFVRIFAESKNFCHIERSEISQKNNRDSSLRYTSLRMTQNSTNSAFFQSFDTNPKNAIYKAIGKALDLSEGKGNLLDATIFLNFRIDIETLKILILQKCTFIICAEKPAFSTIRFAQKFGVTLICFHQGDFLALTHQMRVISQNLIR